jgi:hypothetical protein
LRKVHLGQDTVACEDDVAAPGLSPFVDIWLYGIAGELANGLAGVVDRLDAAAIAALRTVVHGGLIPQFRHGGRGVDALAVVRSKFDGTGLPKEQMGQIHVALGGLGVDIDGGRNGLALLDDGGDKWLGVGALIGA